eukprot:symbB.v1.2.000854.t1/scaffold37.1/size397765/26
MGSQRGERGVWLPSLRRPRPPDVSARHMASVLDAKARNALSACRGLRVVGSSLLFLLSIAILKRCFLGLSIKAIVQMLRANRDGNVVAFLIGALSTVLLQSSSRSLYIAGEMVSSEQLDMQTGRLFAIGTSIGASALPVIVAMMAGCRLHLTRAVWGIASFQILKLFSLGACAILVVPAEILSHGQLLAFTGSMAESMGPFHFDYVNPATWVVEPVLNFLVKINQWRLKAYISGPPIELSAESTGCVDCTYSCLSDRLYHIWHSLNAESVESLDCGNLDCQNGFQCVGNAGNFWSIDVDARIMEVGGVLTGLICGCLFLYTACQFLLRDLAESAAAGRGRCLMLLEKAAAVPGALASFGVMIFTLLLMHDSVSVTCVVTPLCGFGLLPPGKFMCWAMAAQVGSSLAAIAYGATELPFSKGTVQLAWVQLFCSILAILLTTLPFVRRLALHCGLMCATACHEFLILTSFCVFGIAGVLAGIFALTVLWDSSPSFTMCILLVVLPLLISATIWICLRSDWLLPIEVREEVREECMSASRTPRPGASPTFLQSPDPRSPPSARTQPVKSPSPATSPLSPVPHLEIIEEGENRRTHSPETCERTIGPKITASLPVMPVVPRSSRPSGGSDSTNGSVDARGPASSMDFATFADATLKPGFRQDLTPIRTESDDQSHREGTWPSGSAPPTQEQPDQRIDSTGSQGFWPGLWRSERAAMSASAVEEKERNATSWGSSLQVLTSRLRVSSTPISACGSEESC